MSKAAVKAISEKLSTLGYELNRVNSKNWRVYSHPMFPEVAINPNIAERDARIVAKKLDRAHGINQDVNKRNAQAIKERQRIERAQVRAEMDRLDAERAALIRRKELLPTGELDTLTRGERLAIERELQRIDRERQGWVQMMTQLDAAS
jgi:hypothetical protein